jgi:hypothetical protein
MDDSSQLCRDTKIHVAANGEEKALARIACAFFRQRSYIL